jgi:hypothetical protein
VQGGAVTLVPLPGSARLLFGAWFWSLDDCVHGGTISVVIFALFGSTSWFGCDEPLLEDDDELLCDPELCCDVPAPPGVRRIVLDGGAGGEPLAPDEEPPPLPMHGCTAIVSVWAPFGTTTVFDPGGGVVEPGFRTCAWSHVGMTTVRSWCCAGITTWRTPGVISAVDTGSPDELLEELLLLPPHAVNPSASAPDATATASPTLIRISLFAASARRFPTPRPRE